MRRLIQHLLLFLYATALPAAAQGDTADKPNIIWIISDDCGYNDFSMHGSDIPTPRIDSIAHNGARFTNAYATASVCSPARAALLTGRYQQTFGHEFNIPGGRHEDHGLPLTETLISSVLQDAGYRTIAVGKWHLGSHPHFRPTARGFTDFYGFLQGQRDYFPTRTGRRPGSLLRDTEPVASEAFTYLTDHLADEAVRYIEDSKDEPFFLYLAFNGTHSPFQATDEDLAAANGDAIAAMTIALDRAVGKVIDALNEHALTERTLLVFANDHGGTRSHDNAPLSGAKGSLWEGGIRVPFVMQWPAVIPAGQVVDAPVISLDLFPTALAAAGVDAPADDALDGINLVLHLTDDPAVWPGRALYWKSGQAWAVRDGDLKLCVPRERGRDSTMQLFDLSTDTAERRDLADDRPDDVARLLALYEAWADTHQPTAWEPSQPQGRSRGNEDGGRRRGPRGNNPRGNRD
ncbi:sulfatase-like hydrolase/transferase [Phycisphaeraceae bacterium D3-23]